MKKFVDKTNGNKENAVKKISNLPKDDLTVGISWFSSKEITPLSSVGITDVSTMIPENSNLNLFENQTGNAKVFYANELGILEDSTGNTIFGSGEISVTDILLSEQNLDTTFSINNLSDKLFAHSYYVSRGYVLLEKNLYSNNGLSDYIEENKLPESIKVLNGDGDLYVDKNTGKKKYRILLQPLSLYTVQKGTTVPYSIIVLMSDPNPINLSLVYNKVEISAGDAILSTQIKEKETINAIPVYNKVSEESVVVDPTSRDKHIFAKKPSINKSNFIDNLNPTNDGFEVFVPKKALLDNRTYETFNWRLIGKINKNINTSSVNYGQEISPEGQLSQRRINCAVLCTGADLSNAQLSNNYSGLNPYIFERLGKSNFNQSAYSFINPNSSPGTTPYQASYWLVNIDDITDFNDYDILAWSPTSKISIPHGQKIKNFIESKHGTVLLDLSASSLPTDAATSVYPHLTLSSDSVQFSSWEYNTSNIFIDETKTNGWPINDSIFETINTAKVYGIYGSSITASTGLPKSFKYFNSSSLTSTNIVLKENTSTSKPIFVSNEHRPTADALVRGGLLATTAPVMKYCNDIYASSGLYDSCTANSGATTPNDSTIVPTASIEGPMKILSNAVSYSTLSKMQSSRNLDLRSSKYYVVGNWNSSYVLNGSVLLDDEKSQYALMNDSNFPNMRKYCRNLTSSHGSILDYYKKICYDSIPDQYSILLQDIDTSNIELFVEVTNNDVVFANNTLVANDYLTGDISDIPSSYKLYSIQPTQYEAHLHAYTDSPSASFVVPGGFGPHVIKEKPISYSNSLSPDKFSQSLTSSSYRSYPFNFSTYSSYVQSTESLTSFNASWQASVTATGTATYKTVKRDGSPLVPTERKDEPAYPTTGYSSVDVDDNQIIRDLPAAKRIATPKNNFFYSGDINLNKYYLQYGLDAEDKKTGEYVKFIQYTLANCGIKSLEGTKIDGTYSAKTKAAVATFQKAKDEIYTDGGVDSETKSYLIRVWKDLYKNNRAKFDKVAAGIRKNDPEVIKYISEHHNPEINELATSDKDYRRISFTGSKKDGPKGVIRDTIYVRIPEKYNSTPSQGITNAILTSVKIIPGTFPGAKSYKGIKILSIKAYKEKSLNVVDGKSAVVIKDTVDFFKDERVIKGWANTINSDYRWISVTVEGGLLGGAFGPNAEGYSINEISFGMDYVAQPNVFISGQEEILNKSRPFSVSFDLSGSINDINTSSLKVIDLTGYKLTSSTYQVSSPKITYIDSNGNTITDSPLSLIDFNSTSSFVTNEIVGLDQLDTAMTVDYSKLSFLITTPTITAVTTSAGTTAPSSSVGITVLGNKLTLSTSSLNYIDGDYENSDSAPVSNYWMLKQDGSILKNSKNTTTVLDGLLLLCQATDDQSLIGKPIGIEPHSFASIAEANTEVNIDYGFFVLENSVLDTSGYIYGFYDNLRKEFLGTTLHYLEYQNRGPNNIYIGVLATDADGNIGTSIDLIGQRTTSTITPVRIPMKAAYPIYSVSYGNSTKICVTGMQSNASKFDQWPLYISSGSFVKDFYINPSFGWVNWLQGYKKQTLRATYSTLNIENIPWSKFLGRPYIDIVDETPTLLSTKSIQVLATPIASINEPSYNEVGVVKTLIKVYIKDSANSDWKIIPSTSIKNINSNTGIVDFDSNIVPIDSSLIKVSYTIKSNGIPLKQINGNPIPLNPFLNKDIIDSDKPLYIYIKPVNIQAKSNLGSSYVWNTLSNYNYDTPINFTYDNSIFDPYDSVNFDPFALPIAVVHIVNNFLVKEVTIKDMRIRGGGVKASDVTSSGVYGDLGITKLINDVSEALSFWDVYPPLQHAYPKGGFIIIRLPRTVIDNFENEEEIYSIIERNLTAGVAYKLQDTDGIDWGKA